MIGRTNRTSASVAGMSERETGPMLEALESRMLLAGAPFPELSDLVNPNNTVVRLDTNFGDIFFELYDVAGPNGAPPAPNTVENFLGYLRRGDYDETFFHRLGLDQNNDPFVLQGGGFRFIDGTGVSPVPQQAQLPNEFDPGRSNIVRSIAMAKLGGQPDSATSQFFINLKNNTFLDTQPGSGGFTVFGRVANDASWDIVMEIRDLQIRNFNNLGGAFAEVPVTPDFNPGVGPTEATLVTIRDMEVVKPANTTNYYTVQVFYPEGFAGSTINEFLPLANTTGETLHYQVIARAETPQGTAQNGFTWFRDRVLASGTIPAHSRGGITISRFGEGGAPSPDDLVPQGVPYSLEVWATRTITANISHYDFGTSTGESFSEGLATTWAFGEGRKAGDAVQDFLVWSNPNEAPANIAVTFYFQNQAPVTVNVTTDIFRRGGLALAQLPQIPNNSVFSIILESDQPIVAALTHFDQSVATDPMGSSTLGIPGKGAAFGILPKANAGAGVTDTISVVNPGTVAAVVNLTLTFDDDTGLQDLERSAVLILPAQSRGTFDLGTIAQLADGRRYTIRYHTNSGVEVHAGWLHSQGFPGIANADAISNPFAYSASTTWRFAEGFMDPARAGVDVFETISVYNPNSFFFTGQNSAVLVTFNFRYADGHTVTETREVGAGRRLDLDLHNLRSILDEGNNNQRFFYSIEVVSDLPIIAQMWHFDLTLGDRQPSGGFATLGMPGTLVRLDALNSFGGGGGNI